MDALCIYKNYAHQLAAELKASAGVSISIKWIGNIDKQIAVDVARADDSRIHRWRPLQLLVGDTISFVTKKVDKIDEPIESFTADDLVALARSKPKMKPAKKGRRHARDMGTLDCLMNAKHLFSFRLDTNNILLFEFVWLGDRTGRFLIDVGTEVTRGLNIPKVKFGDDVIIRTHSPGTASRKNL